MSAHPDSRPALPAREAAQAIGESAKTAGSPAFRAPAAAIAAGCRLDAEAAPASPLARIEATQ